MSKSIALGSVSTSVFDNVRNSITLSRDENGIAVVSFSCGVGRGSARVEVPAAEFADFVSALNERPAGGLSAGDMVRRTMEVSDEGLAFKASNAKGSRTATLPTGEVEKVVDLLASVADQLPGYLKSLEEEGATAK
jgi:hypothetical protein